MSILLDLVTKKAASFYPISQSNMILLVIYTCTTGSSARLKIKRAPIARDMYKAAIFITRSMNIYYSNVNIVTWFHCFEWIKNIRFSLILWMTSEITKQIIGFNLMSVKLSSTIHISVPLVLARNIKHQFSRRCMVSLLWRHCKLIVRLMVC